MPYLLDQIRHDTLPPYILYRGLLKPAECRLLIDMAERQGMHDATVGNAAKAVHAPKVRTSQVAWIDHDDETRWLYKRLEGAIKDARKNYYHFDLSGFWERIQLTRYEAAQGGHYSMHKDLAAGAASVRKLSMVCLLSETQSFEGGCLKMFGAPAHAQSVALAQGTVAVFPAWELHQVTPVTKGTRYSLVTWLSGPSFR